MCLLRVLFLTTPPPENTDTSQKEPVELQPPAPTNPSAQTLYTRGRIKRGYGI